MADRPTVVTILGVLWLVIALLMFCSSSLALATWHLADMEVHEPAQMDSELAMPWWIFRYYSLLAGAEIVVALTAGVAALKLLRLRTWARRALQMLSWLGLAIVASLAVFQASVFLKLSGLDEPIFSTFFVVALLMGVVIMATPLVLTIWALGRPEVKAAFYR